MCATTILVSPGSTVCGDTVPTFCGFVCPPYVTITFLVRLVVPYQTDWVSYGMPCALEFITESRTLSKVCKCMCALAPS